jgi:hypothetical protein
VVDWSRLNQQVLFVDATDTVRARFAVGIFERISEWNGHGRVMVPLACGIAAEGGSHAEPALAASLMRVAGAWGVRPRLFATPRQRFEEEDIDRCVGFEGDGWGFGCASAFEGGVDRPVGGALPTAGTRRAEAPPLARPPRAAATRGWQQLPSARPHSARPPPAP